MTGRTMLFVPGQNRHHPVGRARVAAASTGAPSPARTRASIAARTGAFTVFAALLLLAASPAAAQDGTGTAGAQVLQLPAGARPAALSGAYTAVAGDADALFYNPAGSGGLRAAASLAYARQPEAGVSFGSAAGAYRLGPVVLGAAAAFLDAGTVSVIEPDPRFGGERGRPTGEQASAGESAVRLVAAAPLLDGRLRLGAGAGVVSSTLADVSRSAPVFDLGAQLDLPYATVGASLRNLGGELTGEAAAPTPLPSEARAGASARLFAGDGIGALVTADLIARLAEGTTGAALGVEAGLLPGSGRGYSAVGRIGYSGDGGDASLGALRLGAGVALGPLAVDYTFRRLDFFGTVHRIGVRWTRGR